MFPVSFSCFLIILKIWTQVVRLAFEKFSVEIRRIVFLRSPRTKLLRMRHFSGKTPEMARALRDCLWSVAEAAIFQAKVCFGLSDRCTVCHGVVTTTEHSPLKRE